MTQPGDVVVINTISIKNGAAAPIARTNEALGTVKIVQSVVARDAIPIFTREDGMLCWVRDDAAFYQLIGGIANGNWQSVALGAPARVTETFTPSLGQTVFALAFPAPQPSQVDMFINTVKYINGQDFTVSGSVLTWLNIPFSLDPIDEVEVVYFI
jgi:hypothetical protein